jgi:hypothetical protein
MSIQAFEEWVDLEGGYLNDSDPGAKSARLIAKRAWQAAKATAPQWHDAPTAPGLWVCLRDSRHKSYRVRDIEVQVTIPEDGDRWYGPIPPDGDKP